MRTLHGHVILADYVARILNTLSTKFERERIWSPRLVVLSLMVASTFGAGRTRLAWKPLLMRLHREYGGSLDWSGVPNPAGLYRAMQKVEVAVLRQTLVVAEGLLSQVVRCTPLVQGRRLIAIDGTRVSMRRTRSLAHRFKLPRGGNGGPPGHYPSGLAVVAYDVLSRVVVAYELASHRTSERVLARSLLRRLPPRSIVLLDRGFPSREMLDVLVGSGIPFIMRMVSSELGGWPEVRDFLRTGSSDARWGLQAITEQGRRRTVQARFILGERPRRGRPRCNRTPKRMLVVTNLDRARWPDTMVIDVYLRRWDIETCFREIKAYLGVESGRAATPETAERELLGALIAHAVVAAAARVTTRLAGKDAWNDPRARRCVITHGLEIVTAAVAAALDPSPRRLRDLQALLQFAGANRQRRRPGRMGKRVAYRKGSMWLWQAERRSA